MTMKTKKTLQHIAAVAVVLLTLCLVFAAPVSAEEESIAYLNDVAYNTIEEAIDASVTDGDVLRLPYHGYTFTNVSGVFYADKEEQTGRMVYLTIVNVGELGVSVTSLKVYGTDTVGDLPQILANNALVEDGDVIILPAASIYAQATMNNPMSQSISVIGAGSEKTVIEYYGNCHNARVLQPYTRYAESVDLYSVFKNMRLNYTGESYQAPATFWIACGYANITLDLENVVITNFPTVFAAFANNGPTAGVGIEINLKNVDTTGNTKLVQFETLPTSELTTKTFVHLIYDGDCSFNDIGLLKYGPVSYGVFSTSLLYKGNMLINGEDITLGSAVAKIGDDYYGSLVDAVADVPTDGTETTITLLKSTEGAGIVTAAGQNVIIDFGEYTYTINELVGSSETETNGFQLLKGSDVELKNGKIAVSESVSENAAILIQNYANLTLSDISLDGTNLGNPHQSTNYCYTLSNNCGDVSIGNGVTIIANANHVAFDVCYSSSYYNAGTHVTVESGATINGLVAFDVWTGDSPINPASSLRINGGTFNGNLVVDGELTEAAKSLIVIYGGTFSSNPSAYIAGGMEVVQPGDKYLVQKYVDRSSSSSSSVKPEEPEQPEEPVVEPETPAAPGEVAASTEVTDGGEVAFETTVVDEETGEQSAPAAADDEIKGVVLPTGTEGTVEFVPVSETPAPAGQEENTKRVFEINVPSYKKGEASVIKFQMTVAEIEADGKTAADVALWHYDEETGEWTKLVTSFIIKDGIVYFEAITNDFSPFAIVYADEPAADLPTDQPEEPTETPASPAPVLAVIAALGAAVVLRRK